MKKRVKKKTKKVTRKTVKRNKSTALKKIKRIKTGIKNLDPLIKGGVKENSISLIAGGAGSGKTIIAFQFLMQGLTKGESCLYITFEEKRDKLYDDLKEFNWDMEKYEQKKRFFYLEYSPEQVKSLIEEGGGIIEQIISKNKITRLVIDSVTSFSLIYRDELSRKEAGLALFELINKWGCTAFLTSQATSKGETLQGLQIVSLEFEADNIILLYHHKIAGRRIRAFEVFKMRGTNHANKTMQFQITPKGITINPSKIIKI